MKNAVRRRAVKNLTLRSFKENKKRNFFIFAAIFLTTFMIASVLSVAMNFNKTINLQNLRSNGSADHAKVIDLSEKNIDLLKSFDFISSVGTYSRVADVVSDEDNYALTYCDEIFWEKHLLPAYIDVEGRYPSKESENEIMLPRRFLYQAEITEPKIGMEIELEYVYMTEEGLQKQSGIFILSGFYTSLEYTSWREPFILPVSKAFFDKIGEQAELKINAGVIFRSNWNVKRNINKLRGEIPPPRDFTVTTPLNYNAGPPTQMIIIFGTMILFLMLTGFLLIYNALNISISNDIRFYGLLKTVGTTSRQIRRIVMGQAARLCVFAIPPGTILALLASFAFVPAVVSGFGSSLTLQISFSPYIYTGAPLLAALTTIIGAAAPARKASRIAPIEAVRYTGQDLNKKRVFTSTRGKPYLMAARNIFFRNKKRMITVFISLFFSLSLFMTVAVITFSMDAEKYLSGMFDNHNFTLRYWGSDSWMVRTWPQDWLRIEEAEGYDQWDFESEDFDRQPYWDWYEEKQREFFIEQGGVYIHDLDFPLFFREPNHKFDEKYLKEIEALPGFISMQTIKRADGLMIYNRIFEPYARAVLSSSRYSTIGESGVERPWTQAEIDRHIENQLTEENASRNFVSYVYGVDVEHIVKIKNTFFPPINIEAFERGETVLFAESRFPELLGNIPVAEIIFENGKSKFRIAGVASGIFGDLWSGWYTPAVIMAKPFLETQAAAYIHQINIRVNNKHEQEALLKLQEMTENDEVWLNSRLELYESLRGIQMFFWIIGGSISGVVGLTGLLNFINVMSVGVMSRKKELAAMESVGMTRRQVRRMLMYEGAGYAAAALLLAGSLGNIIAIKLYDLFSGVGNDDMYSFTYPFIPFIITAFIILSVCVITPLITYRSINKLTIVERLREIE